MQHLEVSGAVRPLKWPLGVKWIIIPNVHAIEKKSDNSKESFKDHYLVVAKVRERLTVIINKQQRSVMGKDLISGS